MALLGTATSPTLAQQEDWPLSVLCQVFKRLPFIKLAKGIQLPQDYSSSPLKPFTSDSIFSFFLLLLKVLW